VISLEEIVVNTNTFYDFFTSFKSDMFEECCALFTAGEKFSKFNCRTLLLYRETGSFSKQSAPSI
jgi:hypothetical protein